MSDILKVCGCIVCGMRKWKVIYRGLRPSFHFLAADTRVQKPSPGIAYGGKRLVAALLWLPECRYFDIIYTL